MTSVIDVAANRAAWVAALRSGDYAQARGALRNDVTGYGGADRPGYCCLGVAEDVRGVAWLSLAEYGERYDRDPDDFDFGDATHLACEPTGGPTDEPGASPYASGYPASTTLSERTRAWLGVLEDNPNVCRRVDASYVVVSLIDLNDDDRLTFAEIADVVADQPPDWDGTLAIAAADARARNAALDEVELATTDDGDGGLDRDDRP